jgi:hypothetical protein
LVKFLKSAGYVETGESSFKRQGELIIYDLYPGNKVYTTELISSPLMRGGHTKFKEWKRIYLGVLNSVDLAITKVFRGTQIDFEDLAQLLKHQKIDMKKLEKRFCETAAYDVSEERVLKNYSVFLAFLKRNGLKPNASRGL